MAIGYFSIYENMLIGVIIICIAAFICAAVAGYGFAIALNYFQIL
jgi:hypothetical protein